MPRRYVSPEVAREEGFDAGEAGLPQSACPYGSPASYPYTDAGILRAAWIDGHCIALESLSTINPTKES